LHLRNGVCPAQITSKKRRSEPTFQHLRKQMHPRRKKTVANCNIATSLTSAKSKKNVGDVCHGEIPRSRNNFQSFTSRNHPTSIEHGCCQPLPKNTQQITASCCVEGLTGWIRTCYPALQLNITAIPSRGGRSWIPSLLRVALKRR